jgi:hypothetical protein
MSAVFDRGLSPGSKDIQYESNKNVSFSASDRGTRGLTRVKPKRAHPAVEVASVKLAQPELEGQGTQPRVGAKLSAGESISRTSH